MFLKKENPLISTIDNISNYQYNRLIMPPEIDRRQNPIVGLTFDQIDLIKFPHMLARKEELEALISNYDLYTQANLKYLGFIKRSKDLAINPEAIRISPELKDFLRTHRPPTLYFEPQDIASLLSQDPTFIVKHEKNEKFERWEFNLDPKKNDNLRDEKSIILTRGDLENDIQNPYLVVGFPAKYDNGNIVFHPKVVINGGRTGWFLTRLLNLKEKSVSTAPLQLNFAVKETPGWSRQVNEKGKMVQREWKTYSVEISLKKGSPPEEKKTKGRVGFFDRIFLSRRKI